MKKITLLIVVFLSLTLIGFGQTLQVANNNPGAENNPANNVYGGATALQDAINASVAGDIIYVVPSINNYGDITIDRSLTLFGIGIRPQRDNSLYSTVRDVYITASNVTVSGLEIVRWANGIRLGDISVTTLDGILIQNCRVRSYITDPSTQVSNLVIRNNVFFEYGSSMTITNSPGTVVENNVVIHTGSGRSISADNNVTFRYNLFAGNQPLFFFDLNNCTLDHNIFYGERVDDASFASVTNNNKWNYNLAFGNSSDAYNVFVIGVNGNTGIGNLESASGSFDPLFVNFPLSASTWSNSYDFSLQAGSPALAGSTDNPTTDDIGPSGGNPPFDYEGNLLPLIQSITMPATITVGSDLPVTIKAKGN